MYCRLNDLDFICAIHLSQAIFNNGHKFSVGFKSGEFPGQSSMYCYFHFFEAICYHFNLVAGCRVLLKNCMWMAVRQFSADFSFDDLQISFAAHHALD